MQDSSGHLFKKTLIVTSAATLTLCFFALIYLTRWILLVTAIGLAIGTIAGPVVVALKQKLRIPKGLSAVFFILFLLLGIVGIGYVIVNLISSELLPLAGQFPTLLSQARDTLVRLLGGHAVFQKYLQSIQIGPAIQGAIQTIYQGLQLGTVALAGLSFALFVALYLASSPQNYQAGFLSVFPAHKRPEIARLLKLSASILRRWFSAQLIAMSAVGFTTALGLWAIGVPYAAGFGVLTALLDIVPYIGPLIAFLTIAVITLASNPENLLWVAGIFVLMQNFEGNVVIPLVMRAGVQLPPIHLMILMLMMGQWFGIFGILVAPPTLAIARAIYLTTYVPRMDERAVFTKAEKKAG